MKMSRQYCLVCASDEGFFLDIYNEEKNFCENLEKCLSMKIKKGTTQSTKICHKCAYEIDQCSKFVDKFKTSRSSAKKSQKKRGICSLCMEAGQKSLIFTLGNDGTSENPKKKLHAIFNDNFITDQMTNISICLDCRYNVDVLYDLKRIYEYFKYQQETDEDNNPSSDLKKVKTHVIKRKTTSPKSLKCLDEISDTENSSNTTTKKSKRSASLVKSKSNEHSHECDECHKIIEVGVDTYCHSGSKVCKSCWLKINPNDAPVMKKRKVLQKPTTSTKLCSVFLEDIFFSSSDNKKKSLIDKTDDESMNVTSDYNINEKKIKQNLRSSKLKTKDNSKNENPSKQLKVAGKKHSKITNLKDNEIPKKSMRKIRSVSTESIPESIDRVKITKSRLKALKKKKYQLPKLKSENLEKSRSEERHKKLRLQRLKKRSRNNSSLSTREISQPMSTHDTDKELIINADNDSENSQSYTCNVCSTDYENRVEGLKHQLTHSKKLGVVLEKVAVSENDDNDQTSNVDVIDTSASEAARNIVDNSTDFDTRTVTNDNHNIEIANKTINCNTNEATEEGTMNETKNTDEHSSKYINNRNLSENMNTDQSQDIVNDNQCKDIVNEDKSDDIANESQSEDTLNDNQPEDIVNKNSCNHYRKELNKQPVDNDEQNTNVDEQISIADRRNSNVVNAEEDNFEAKDSDFEVEKSNIDVDSNDCHDCKINTNLNKVNQHLKYGSSNNEYKPEETEVEYKKKINTFESNLEDNDSANNENTVNDGDNVKNNIQQKEDTDNCSIENPKELISVCDRKFEESIYQNQTVMDCSNRIEDSQSERVNESSKINNHNTEKELEIVNAENDKMLVEDNTETESKLDDYEDKLVIDEKVENLESSINVQSEKDENDKVDKLQKIIDASFGNSLQE